jgi:hypothetical protein
MLHHVLVPYDESEPAQRALSAAADVASRTGARLTVAHVAPPPVDEPLNEAQAIVMELFATGGASALACPSRGGRRLVGCRDPRRGARAGRVVAW